MALEEYVPQPYAGEIRGLASHLGGTLSDVILLNFAYEVSAYVRFFSKIRLDICSKDPQGQANVHAY